MTINTKIKLGAISGTLTAISFFIAIFSWLLIIADSLSRLTIAGSAGIIHQISLLIACLFGIFYIYGVYCLGSKYENNLLQLSSIVLMAGLAIIFRYSILLIIDPKTIMSNFLDMNSGPPKMLILFWGLTVIGTILIGVSLIKLKGQLGSIAKIARIMGIIIGASFLTLFGFFIGIILAFPFFAMLTKLMLKASIADVQMNTLK